MGRRLNSLMPYVDGNGERLVVSGMVGFKAVGRSDVATCTVPLPCGIEGT